MGKTRKVSKTLIKDLSEILSEVAVEGMQEKKGKNIVVMDLRNIKNAVTDFFVVCHGDSRTQVEALARSVEEEISKKTGEDPWHREGMENAEWVLLDYINVVVHIFQNEKREFFGVERLWADAEVKQFES